MSKFFEQLRLDLKSIDEEEKESEDFGFTFDIGTLSFKRLMDAFNLRKRWVYLGNSSIPPCKYFVYWNILHTVYPIEPKYYLMMKNKYKGRFNNARAIYPVNTHIIKYISANRLLSKSLAIVLASCALIAFA